MNHPTGPAAKDGEEVDFHTNDQDWVMSWHLATLPPPGGKSHGSAAVCLTFDGNVVLVSPDGKSWDLPGGRPEGDEGWRETLDREVLEEACAWVEEATLLGFTKGVCMRGPAKGLTLVRSVWCAVVSLRQWDPQNEINYRRLVPFNMAQAQLTISQCPRPIFQRVFNEASAILTDLLPARSTRPSPANSPDCPGSASKG